VVAGNGIFFIRNTKYYRSSVKVEGISWLEDHEESLHLNFPLISESMISKAVGFFQKVYQVYESEAIALLYFSERLNRYALLIPIQEIEFYYSFYGELKPIMGVKYHTPQNPRGYYRVGTIHSHADLPAFHSYLDMLDEANDDGFHITVGKLNTKIPDFASSFVVNGKRFDLKTKDILEGFQKPGKAPDAWLDRIICIKKDYGQITVSGF
jgi:hypothetical protein